MNADDFTIAVSLALVIVCAPVFVYLIVALARLYWLIHRTGGQVKLR